MLFVKKEPAVWWWKAFSFLVLALKNFESRSRIARSYFSHTIEWHFCLLDQRVVNSYSVVIVRPRIKIHKRDWLQWRGAYSRMYTVEQLTPEVFMHALGNWGPIFEMSYDELMKNLGWACGGYQKILQKSYEKLQTNLCKTYEKLTTTLQISYKKNIKFAASDVIRDTLCQRLLLVEYFEL